jgi:hypothetical protein
MSKTNKQKISEGYNRLKKIFEQVFKKQKEQHIPALILQPGRQNKLRGTGPY